MTSESIEDALDAFVRSKQKGTDSGNYQRNARRVIGEWISWLAGRDEPVETFDQLQVSHMRQYARHLKELVTENPARTRRAEEELPDKRPRSDRQQFWSRADRETLLTHLNERAYTAVDERGLDAVK